MAPVEVQADSTVTVQTPVPEFVVVEIMADSTVPIFTSTPEFVTYEVGG